jgi:hypothetical protein
MSGFGVLTKLEISEKKRLAKIFAIFATHLRKNVFR